jgi:hypothetical protein
MAATAAVLLLTGTGHAQTDPANALARDIFKELIEINTTDSVGNVTTASEAMAKRLRAAAFAAEDIQILGPNDRKKNLVVRLRGSGKPSSGCRAMRLITPLCALPVLLRAWTGGTPTMRCRSAPGRQ